MRIIYLLILVLFFSGACFAQPTFQVNTKIPKRKTRSVEKLAETLTHDGCSDYDAAKRIYNWITANIRYDVKRYDRFNWKETTPKQTLRRRKALCSGYSQLYQALCKEAGIKAWVVSGYDKIPGYRNNEPYFFEEHAWNVFHAGGAYHLVDATWGSGGILRKIKIIRIFGTSIYLYKSKFVPQYNPLFFDADTSWFLRTHVPLLPMWQLKTTVLTVERFERQLFVPDSGSKNSVSVDPDIQSYDLKTKEDAGLYDGNKGYHFFKRNNRTKAFHTYDYLIDYYKKYRLGNKKCSDNTRKKIAGSYADTVIVYGRKFFKDNIVRHKYVLDSIENRDKTIYSFSNKLYKEDWRNRKKIKWQMGKIEEQISDQKSSIEYRHIGFKRASVDDIEKIRRAYSKKHVDTLAKIIAGLKNLHAVNTRKIDSLNICRRFWEDSVQIKMPVLDSIHQAMAHIYEICRHYISSNTGLNQQLKPLHLICKNQDSIVAARRQLKILQNEYVAIQRYIFAVYFGKNIDPLNRAGIQFIKQNKSIIKRIAKINVYNDTEKEQYRIENKNLYDQLKHTTQRSNVKIQMMHMNIDWLHEYKMLLKQELSALRKELIWQHAINRGASKVEAKRNKFYVQSMVYAINTALQIKKSVRLL